MSAEICSVSMVHQLSIKQPKNLPQGYYRSKLFIAPYTSNPLLAAAGPLFSLLERLGISPSLPAVQHIRNNIEHELCAFHSRLSASDYSQELIAIAHYILCATIDELLGKSYLRLYGESADFKAFTPLTQDGAEPQTRFFEIIHQLKERPTQYLDIIELAYYCLIAGFEGEQHMRADGRQNLDNLIEELYLLIQKNRVYKPCKLNHQGIIPKAVPKKRKSVLITSLVTLSILLSAFWINHTCLEKKANEVLFGHLQHLNLDN